MTGYISFQDAVNSAFELDTLTATDEEKFIARVYLCMELKRMQSTFSPLTGDTNCLSDRLQVIDARLVELQ